jgi:hypothetical protein
LRHPRAFVASCWLEWPENEPVDWNSDDCLPVVADITCYEVREHFGWRHSGRVRGDRAWLRRHWRELLAVARASLPRPLHLQLGELDGTCLRCGGCLRRIERVLSSPWSNGVGDWRHWCPRCQVLTVPATEVLARIGNVTVDLDRSQPGAVGHALLVSPGAGAGDVDAVCDSPPTDGVSREQGR